MMPFVIEILPSPFYQMRASKKSFMSVDKVKRTLFFLKDTIMDITFKELATPTPKIATVMDKWENDPELIPFIRPNPTEEDLAKQHPVTVEFLQERLEYNHIYLIYTDGQLVGEVSFQIDPGHLYKKEPGTAWVGINIGEKSARGKGIGAQAMLFLEEQAKGRGLKRMELGVFEFNIRAIQLYTKLGYREIVRIDNFTFWQGKMWQDIRMEKYME